MLYEVESVSLFDTHNLDVKISDFTVVKNKMLKTYIFMLATK